ncbi:HTH-type transcriptional repressor DasR [bioreactor metagenome]|jgi:DNA-binding GntR family transcriptional regulator|uniref:HTH-type transcriptional repressor DasR n=1 Tax=bioreactor metagenome TaxID=1076179 RepID=A0A645AS45_9ZZZZ|nr:GntR family transcriptional regulator [Spirochaetia bacterium]VBB41202.1 putative UbiC transcription regulator-associated [uncultured Spirochaetota bacterium]
MKRIKYLIVREWLHTLIREDKILVGEKLPTEEELAQKFNVNRMTVRKAFDELVTEKLIERRQGKGTFLIAKAPLIMLHDTGKIVSILAHLKVYGIEGTFKNLKISKEIPPERQRRVLGVREGEEIVRIDRIISISNEPMIFAISYLAPRFSGIINMDLSQPLYDLLSNEFNIVLHHSDESYSAVEPSGIEKEVFLDFYSGPFIKLENTLYEMNDRPIGCFDAIFRGDKFKFRAHAMEYIGIHN